MVGVQGQGLGRTKFEELEPPAFASWLSLPSNEQPSRLSGAGVQKRWVQDRRNASQLSLPSTGFMSLKV